MSALKINWNDLVIDECYIYEYKSMRFTGQAYDYGLCNEVLAETQFVEGVKQGVETEWNTNGQILSTYGFYCNRPHGACVEYSPNGMILLESEYEFGVCIFEKRYKPDGTLFSEYSIKLDHEALSDLHAARRVFLSG